MTPETKEKLRLHEMWLLGEPGGVRAIFYGSDPRLSSSGHMAAQVLMTGRDYNGPATSRSGGSVGIRTSLRPDLTI